MQEWRESPYGGIIRMVNSDTLNALHGLWGKYAEFRSDPKMYQQIKMECKRSYDRYYGNAKSWNLTRSFGPRTIGSLDVSAASSRQFWETGGVERENIDSQQMCNPLFIYSHAAGSRFALHYGSDPLAAFQLAAGVTKLTSDSPFYQHDCGFNVKNIVAAAKSQFGKWLSAFQDVALSSRNGQRKLRIRVYVGDGIAFAFGINKIYEKERTISLDYGYSRPWSHAPINLDDDGYASDTNGPAPLRFNVIDSSNLIDHVGSINLMVAIVPLLLHSPSSTLYTETMIRSTGDELALLSNIFCGNVPTMCTLFGISPITYLTGVSIRGWWQDNVTLFDKTQPCLYRISWKHTTTFDPNTISIPAVTLEPEDLASLMYDVYLKMFWQESVVEYQKAVRTALTKIPKGGSSSLPLPHYTRSSFAALLAFLKPRIIVDWDEFMSRLLLKIEMDIELTLGTNSIQDLFLQLHLFGVFTRFPFGEAVQGLRIPGYPPLSTYRPVKGILQEANPPNLTCLIITVPRSKLRRLYNKVTSEGPYKGAHMLFQLNILADDFHNMFSSIHPIFGSLIASRDQKQAEIKEDPEGWHGTADLHFCAYIPTYMFFITDPRRVQVAIRLLNDASSFEFKNEVGPMFDVFTVSLLDRKYVHFVASLPRLNSPNPCPLPILESTQECIYPLLTTENDTFTARFTLRDQEHKRLLANGESVTVRRTSPCTLTMTCGPLSHNFRFPFPVAKDSRRIRIARKSAWIEVIPELAHTPTNTCDSLIFPLVPELSKLCSWNLPYINFSQLPRLDISDSKSLRDWLHPHLNSMFSDAERRSREEKTPNLMADVKDSLFTGFFNHIIVNKLEYLHLLPTKTRIISKCCFL